MIDYKNLVPIVRTPEQIEKSLWNCSTLPIYNNSKVCATEHGHKSAVKNMQISSFCACGYNIAISLPFSNLACIDVDMHGNINGLKAFFEFIEKYGEIDSYTELTATNGGLHIFVRKEGFNENVRNCELAPGVELKVNGYVVCAPSIYKGKEYKILRGVNSNGTYNFATLNEKWLNFINNKATENAKNFSVNKKTDKSNFAPSETPLEYKRMIENCRLLKFMYENPDEIPEPVWFSAISMLTRNASTNDFIHLISQGYSKYTYQETEYKIEHCRSTSKHCGCNYIATNYYEYCKGCPKAEQIKRRNNYEQ